MNCYIKSNSAVDASVLWGFDVFNFSIEIVNTTFELNLGSTSMIDLSDSTINLENCFFVSNVNPTIYLTATLLQISNVTFSNNSCDSLTLGCLISLNQYSTLIIDNAIFFGMAMIKTQTGVLYSLNSTVQMQNVTFSNLASLGVGTCLYCQYTDLTVNDSEFSSFYPSCIYTYGGNLSLYDVGIGNSVIESSPLIVEDVENLWIESSQFYNNSGAANGGALFLEKILDSLVSEAILLSNSFYNNSAESYGGAIYTSNQYVEISNTSFKENKAYSGGAIFFDTASNSTGGLILDQVTFTSNNAFLEGGAIKSTTMLPTFKSSILTFNNTALYGNDYGSYPIRIVFQVYDSQNISC